MRESATSWNKTLTRKIVIGTEIAVAELVGLLVAPSGLRGKSRASREYTPPTTGLFTNDVETSPLLTWYRSHQGKLHGPEERKVTTLVMSLFLVAVSGTKPAANIIHSDGAIS